MEDRLMNRLDFPEMQRNLIQFELPEIWKLLYFRNSHIPLKEG